MKWIYKHTNLN